MSKIRTLALLQEELDKEASWRIKEIINLKMSVRGSDIAEATLIRAGTALLYAHWEGFVKASSLAYLEFVNCQGLKYSELKSCFALLGLRSHLAKISQSGKSKIGQEALDFINKKWGDRASISNAKAINTESNLSSIVFSNIADTLNIDLAPYQTRFNFIDESLLARRNKIAHGEFLDLDATEWRTLADQVLLIIQHYKTDLENAASLASYRS